MRIPIANEWRSFRGEEPDRKEAGDRGARLHDEAAYSLGPSALSWSAKRLWSAVPWHRFEGGGKPPHFQGCNSFGFPYVCELLVL
jgi:hypothetical protein